MAKINVQKIILHILREAMEPFASPKYTHNYILQGVLKSIEDELREKPPRWYKYSANRAYKKLIEDNVIKIDKNGLLHLTEKGNRQLLNYELDDFVIKKPKIWDRKYRVITFDISEQKHRVREALRKQLVAWGLVRLQNSVWVHPYECEEVIAMLKTHFGITDDVVYITAESIENDNWLKEEFGLY